LREITHKIIFKIIQPQKLYIYIFLFYIIVSGIELLEFNRNVLKLTEVQQMCAEAQGI